MTATVHPHGDDRRYTIGGCRCHLCRAGHTETRRHQRRAVAYGQWEGLRDATGTRRRIRALAATGWPYSHLAALYGIKPKTIRRFVHREHGKVQAAVARRFAIIYDELCTEDGPSTITRAWAAKQGWHGPEAWTDDTIDNPQAEPAGPVLIDEVLVRRAAAGNPQAAAQLTRPERVAATRILLARDVHTDGISERLGVARSTAHRLIQAARQNVAA